MKRPLSSALLAGISAISWIIAAHAAMAQTPAALQERVDRLQPGGTGPGATRAPLAQSIKDFYTKRAYRPLWFAEGRLAPRAAALIDASAKAGDHGLNPALYGMPRIAESARGASGEAAAEAEIALTRAYLVYATHIASGAIENPRRLGGLFRDVKRPPPELLLDGIANAADPAAYLAQLPPDLRRYDALKAALAAYRRIELAGGWPRIDPGPPLKPGMRGLRVAQVKRRLAVTGDLRAPGVPEVFDENLVAAVKNFQARHGLKPDGGIGAETLAEMNVPVQARIEHLIINLERRRWLAPYLGDRYVYLNIADNDLKVVEKGHTVHVARVIVGKPFQQTPAFSATMQHIELNPYWNVPRSIAVNELLPSIRRNPRYLANNGYVLLRRSGDNSSAVDPASVDWSAGFPYFIRQMPGPQNALGHFVFRFPNAHNVYLHDTPSRELFDREPRFFSHGCMRVEFPMRLALLLLGGQDNGMWTEARINAVIATRTYTVVPLQRPIAMHITYLTAWAERDGTVEFRRDAYRRDGALKAAMSKIVVAGPR